jgi:eukaryotic-like serine/threonine-protein kinase
MRLLIAAVLALLVVGGGAAAFALTRGGTDPAQAAPPSTPAAAATATPVAPTSAAAATTVIPTSAAPSPTPSAAADAAADPVAFVQRYYSLLPENPDAAFALLSPAAQSESGGHDRFANFYSDMAAVTLQDPRQTGDNTVSARVRFVRKSGITTNEAYSFTMNTTTGGTTVMQSFSH